MRSFGFVVIPVIIAVLVVAGCTKIESSQGGQNNGMRFGFVEKEIIPPTALGENMAEAQESKPRQEPVINSGPSRSPPEETVPTIAEVSQSISSLQANASNVSEGTQNNSADAQNTSIQNSSQNQTVLLPNEGTNETNETNTTFEQANGQNASSENQVDSETALGFEIRIDANRYYRDGAVRCHNESIPQCVHIRIGPQGCGTDCHFDPEAIMVPIGTTIEWGNYDSAMHQTIAQDESFLSGPLEPVSAVNGTYPNYAASHFSSVFNTPGEYRYYGEQGSSLAGTVVVVTLLS